MGTYLTLEELSYVSGVSPRTIRLYQSRGAFRPVKLPGSGNRAYYADSVLAKLTAIRDAAYSLDARTSAEVVEYRVGQDSKASEMVNAVLVDGSIVMSLKDGTIVIRKPLPKEVYR